MCWTPKNFFSQYLIKLGLDMLQMISYFDLLQIFRQKIIGVKFQDDIGDYVILLPTTTQNV